MKNLGVLAFAMFLGLALAACEKEGPAERAGEEIDKAAKDVGRAVDNAADAVKDAAK
jgi:hypothetical protein